MYTYVDHTTYNVYFNIYVLNLKYARTYRSVKASTLQNGLSILVSPACGGQRAAKRTGAKRRSRGHAREGGTDSLGKAITNLIQNNTLDYKGGVCVEQTQVKHLKRNLHQG